METEMALCKCGAFMYREGNWMVCPNMDCGRRYELPHKVPPQAELLDKIKQLEKENIGLKALIKDLGYEPPEKQ